MKLIAASLIASVVWTIGVASETSQATKVLFVTVGLWLIAMACILWLAIRLNRAIDPQTKAIRAVREEVDGGTEG